MPQVSKMMTALPQTIGMDLPLKVAKEFMQKHQVRHLPVLDGGKLVGILSDRDIKFAGNFDGAEAMIVADVMTPDPYSVTPDQPLDAVVTKMAEHRYGCAVVEQTNGKVVGIFTANDGLRVLTELLQQAYTNR